MTGPNRSRWLSTVLASLLVGAGLLAIVQGVRRLYPPPPATPMGLSSRPGERLLPTAPARTTGAFPVPSIQATGDATSAAPVATAGPAASPAPSTFPVETQPAGTGLYTLPDRIGAVAPLADMGKYDLASLGAGWYLLGNTQVEPSGVAGAETVQLVTTSADTLSQGAVLVRDAARSNPGSLWLIGNEPDVIWQGNATPQEYARVYHDAYEILKEADPTCQVAIGGVSQVTPLRLRYLDAVMAAYQDAHGGPMPVDVWNIHLAILREERGSWGVDIPPGLPDDAGILREIDDNADIEILKRQVFTFRGWMKDRDQRDKPLIVTEFSVLMPPEYGFPFERVRDFMVGAFDFLLTAADDSLGYPADGHRLVQRAAWYSLADHVYSTGNLFDPSTTARTPLGAALADYIANAEKWEP